MNCEGLASSCFYRSCSNQGLWLIFFGLLMGGLAEDLIIGLFLLVFYNGADSMLTYYMARKGYILEKKQSILPATDRLAQSSA